MNRSQQQNGHHQSEYQAHGRKQRHEQVVEREHLIAQHRQPVEVLGSFVVFDRGYRSLKTGNVRLQSDGDLVAEAPLDAAADHPQVPGERGRHPKTDGGNDNRRATGALHTVDDQLQPERQQGVGDHHQQRQAQ